MREAIVADAQSVERLIAAAQLDEAARAAISSDAVQLVGKVPPVSSSFPPPLPSPPRDSPSPPSFPHGPSSPVPRPSTFDPHPPARPVAPGLPPLLAPPALPPSPRGMSSLPRALRTGTGTMDDLIEDKIASARWLEHFDPANPVLVNVSTLALTLSGRRLHRRHGRSFVQRIGEPVIRSAVMQAMKILGSQFVVGRDIEEATKVARRAEKDGYTYSYDMLGEAARTEADAKRYRAAYAEAIAVLAARCTARACATIPACRSSSRRCIRATSSCQARPRHGRTGRAHAGAGADGARRQYGLQHRCRGSRPARPVARCHRGRPRR